MFFANPSSTHFNNVLVTAFLDKSDNLLRIRQAVEGDFIDLSSEDSACATPESQASESTKKLSLPEKKAKVPRPPNSFILYRTKYHPILLKSQPELKNNEISVILGKQWRNESEEVRAEFEAMAAKIKKQHALENPGYQYAPRKSSEKKRRMTARKLAKLRARSDSDVDMTDVGDLNNARLKGHKAAPAPRPLEVNMFYPNNAAISTGRLLRNERTRSYPSNFRRDYRIDDMSITFPAGRDDIEYDYEIRAARYEPRADSEHINLATNEYTDIKASTEDTAIAGLDFMNSLVDWSGIMEDAEHVHESIEKSNLERFTFETAEERAEFQEEMNAILAVFE